ncbi:DnaJ C-terminal domain-containing protein [Calidifontibacter terrae]
MASQDWLDKDFYNILGVPQDASEADIKKAYRKLARKWHPDQNPGDAAAEQTFKDIGEAHQVLADPKSRQEYDQLRAMVGGGARFGGGSGGNGGFEDLFSTFGGAGGGGFTGAGGGGQTFNLEDILGQFGGGFGGQSPYGGGGFGRATGADTRARTTLTFRQAVEGDTLTLNAGGGRTLKTRIPAGVKDGQTIRLAGKGEPGPGGNGDLLLEVSVAKHPVFGREGNNLTIDLPVTFAEATLGATVSVPTLDGKSVKVKVAAGTPSGRVLRIKGRGVPARAGAGDLLAKVQVVVPTALSDDAKAAVATIAAEQADPRADLVSKAAQ